MSSPNPGVKDGGGGLHAHSAGLRVKLFLAQLREKQWSHSQLITTPEIPVPNSGVSTTQPSNQDAEKSAPMLRSPGLQDYRASRENQLWATNDLTNDRFHDGGAHQTSKTKNANHFLTRPVVDHRSLVFCFSLTPWLFFSWLYHLLTLFSLSRKQPYFKADVTSLSLTSLDLLFTKSRQIFKNSSPPIPTTTLVAAQFSSFSRG